MLSHLVPQVGLFVILFALCPYAAAQEAHGPAPPSQTLADFNAEEPRPKFTDYPVNNIYRGEPAAPIITEKSRGFRTRIRRGARSAVEFAGHYTMPGWGCGTGCSGLVVVDSKTGKIYDGVGGELLPDAWVEQHEADAEKIEFHPNSRLLKVNACPNEHNCGLYDYVMVEGKGLKLIRRQLLPAEFQPPPFLLRNFLQDYVSKSGQDKVTRYFAASVSLRDDTTLQVIVYLTNDGWCGSVGCTALILEPKDFDFRVVTKITATRLPIRLLSTKTNGWHDLAVHVQGGGVEQAYEVKLSFDGKSYPLDPSVPPAQPVTTEIAGEVIVPTSATGEPLFP